MTRHRLRELGGAGLIALALVAGVALGGALGLAGHGGSAAAPKPALRTLSDRVRPVGVSTLLAWTPGGLPMGFGHRVAALSGVRSAVAVWSGTLWMRGLTVDGAETLPDRPGFDRPIDVAGADLRDLAAFLPPSDRSILPALAHGEAALGAGAAAQLGAGEGAVLRLGGADIRVAAILPDALIGANQAFVSRATALRLGIDRPRYVIVAPSRGTATWRLADRIRNLLPAGARLQVRSPGETPYFRQGDAVLPPGAVEQLFGWFDARLMRGRLVIDPAWVSRHIVAARVPLLGIVRCNRAIIPQLSAALREIEQEGLGHLVDRGSYGGCFRPALLHRDDPQAGISHHSWGIAIDLNLSTNRLGEAPQQDRRVVDAFRHWGFTWGGSWLIPFGAQFEVVTPRDGP